MGVLERSAEQASIVFCVRVSWQVSPVAMSIGKTLVTVILAAHLLSCFWFWVHCYDALQEVMHPETLGTSPV